MLAEHLAHLGQHAVARRSKVQAQVGKRSRGELPARMLLRDPHQTEQHVLGADVLVVQRARFPEGLRQGQLGRLAQGKPAGPVQRALGRERYLAECPGPEALLDPALDLVQVDAEALAAIGIDLDEIKRRIEESFGPGALERVPLTPRGPLNWTGRLSTWVDTDPVAITKRLQEPAEPCRIALRSHN